MDCRTGKSCNLKRTLGHDVINTKEQTVLKSIKDAFEGENMQTQYSALGYRIDLYFLNTNLQLKLMNWHAGRSISNETACVFIRINSDETKIIILKEINKIHRHIKKSTKE